MIKKIVQALRCASTPGGPTGDCEKCQYWKTEQLTAEQKEKLGVDTWTSCDIDKVGTDAANLIERLTAENAALRERNTMEKKILDVTCGSRTIWFNKTHPAAVYCDSRRESYTGIWKSTKNDSERQCVIAPDIQCDFTDLPFADDTFSLVVFDPPHLKHIGENAWLRKKYGALGEDWPKMLHDGFRECMRVLKPDGVLIFKWAETQIPAGEVWEAIGEKPLFGHRSGKNAKTFWGCFMKLGLPEAPEGGGKHE